MDSGFYAALSGLVARTQALDIAANNLANVSTTGYKSQHEFYRALTASLHGAKLSPLNRAVNDYSVLGGAAIDLQSGSLQSTGNDFDIAIEGPSFLAVQTKAGIRYTRNGSLHLGPNGELLSAQGDQVLGDSGPLSITGTKISISSDGTLSSDGAIVDKLRLVDFAPNTALVPEGSSYFTAPQGAGKPAEAPGVRQGVIESSNISPITGTVDLIALQRHADMLRRALSIFYNDFQRAATQELPQVP